MNIRKKILLIDDDKDDQLNFCRSVNEIDPAIECLIANNGMEAMLHLRTINPKPELIFLDLNMPLMNGYEYLEELREQKIYNHIPIVIFTTSNTDEDRERCKKLGVSEFMVKPTDVEVLKKKLKQIFEKNLRGTS
jgi:CheY-like chemotaxis protein